MFDAGSLEFTWNPVGAYASCCILFALSIGSSISTFISPYYLSVFLLYLGATSARAFPAASVDILIFILHDPFANNICFSFSNDLQLGVRERIDLK